MKLSARQMMHRHSNDVYYFWLEVPDPLHQFVNFQTFNLNLIFCNWHVLDKCLTEVPIPPLQQSLDIISDSVTDSKRELFFAWSAQNLLQISCKISNSLLTFYFEVKRFRVGDIWDVAGPCLLCKTYKDVYPSQINTMVLVRSAYLLHFSIVVYFQTFDNHNFKLLTTMRRI